MRRWRLSNGLGRIGRKLALYAGLCCLAGLVVAVSILRDSNPMPYYWGWPSCPYYGAANALGWVRVLPFVVRDCADHAAPFPLFLILLASILWTYKKVATARFRSYVRQRLAGPDSDWSP